MKQIDKASSRIQITQKIHFQGQKPQIYVDTNILQGAISHRDTEAIVFLNKATINGWEIFTSIHTLMELLDIAKDRQFLMRSVIERWTDVATFTRNRGSKNLSIEDLTNIAKEVNNFFLSNSFIHFININDGDWNLVKKIGENSNLHSSDVLHLVTAYVGACTLLVTHDQEFIREGNKVLANEKVADRLQICDIMRVERRLQQTPKVKIRSAING